MKSLICSMIILCSSLPAFAQLSDPANDTMKKTRISIAPEYALCVSGTISDLSPKDAYSEIYSSGFGLNLSFEYNWFPGLSTGSDLGFLYFGDSNDFNITEYSLSPPLTLTYHYSSMILMPIHVFIKIRFPLSMEPNTWFMSGEPPRIQGFSLYMKPSFGMTYLTNTVKILVDGGTYNGSPYTSQDLTYWESQAFFSYRISFGFEIASESAFTGFFELIYHGTTAPNVVDDYSDKSSPIGMFGFMGGAIIAFGK